MDHLPPDLAVAYLPAEALVPNTRNARTHSKRQLHQIANSIREFGFTNPVLIDEELTVIAGHGRLAAAQLLGIPRVPTIRLEHLSEDQKRAYVIADNRLAEKAGWDKAILAIELQHLLSLDAFDVTITGFEVPEIDLAIEGTGAEKEDEPVPLDPDLPAVTRPGDLWRLGPHRALCADALEPDSYERLMQGARARLIFTDPPYNVPIEGHVCGNGSMRHREFAMASGEMSEAEFTQFLRRATRLLVSHSEPGSIHFICMDWRHQFELLSAARGTYAKLLNLCVWAKTNAGMGSLYRSQHELIFVFKNGSAPHRNNVELGRHGRSRTNLWTYPRASGLDRGEEGNLLQVHPTVKPVCLVADAILDCSERNDIVLDPFLGSGSTLLAAERVGRTCYAMELDPLYVDAAIRRWQRYSGGSAIHAETGASFQAIAGEGGHD